MPGEPEPFVFVRFERVPGFLEARTIGTFAEVLLGQ
jgi:hypothetical protein